MITLTIEAQIAHDLQALITLREALEHEPSATTAIAVHILHTDTVRRFTRADLPAIVQKITYAM